MAHRGRGTRAASEEAVPPVGYGGIEQTVHLVDQDLTARGHDVTLMASGGSSAAGRLVPLTSEPLGTPGTKRDVEGFRAIKDHAARRAAEVIHEERPDIVLNHSWRVLDYLRTSASLTTVHYPLDTGGYRQVFHACGHATYVSISRAQQRDAPGLTFAGNVYNGIDVAALPYAARGGAISRSSGVYRRTRGSTSRSVRRRQPACR